MRTMTRKALLEKIKKVKILLLDVDGVLTDGRIVYDSSGRDMKFFDVHDGLGVYLLKSVGIPAILVTAKGSKTLAHRAKDMRISEIFENIFPKSLVLDEVVKKYKVTPLQVCFVGDDLVDLSIMKRVGFAVAVANAAPEIKAVASYVTRKKGGRGAVREVVELILKTKGVWHEALRIYDV